MKKRKNGPPYLGGWLKRTTFFGDFERCFSKRRMVVSPQIRSVWWWYWLWHVAVDLIYQDQFKNRIKKLLIYWKSNCRDFNRDLICGPKMLTKHRYTTDWETADHWNATRRAVLAIYMPIVIAGSAGNLATCCLPHTHLAYQWTLPAWTTSTLSLRSYQKSTKWYKSW